MSELPAITAPSNGATGPACGDPGAGGQAVRTLIDEFLADQADTTAVERFARAHDAVDPDVPLRSRYYRDLMPASPPGPGQQYAFEVDLDACSGCKACVVACTNLNGLPDGTSFRETGTLVGQPTDQQLPTGQHLPVLRTVTTACHHCVEPGCLEGCPANAYEKDPDTGVVRHLDDQCIGCGYCTLTCPYEVPQYDDERGIVRKCDLCHDRLADGEAPACVQACPTHAISVRVVDVDRVVAEADEPWGFLAPDPATTVPTTSYRSSEDLTTGVQAVDHEALSPAHAHTPLAVMLVLTQVAVGTLLALVATWLLGDRSVMGATAAPAAVTALVTAGVAFGASVFHLGRPLQAWRAVLGFGHSWMSREIVAFGLFAGAAGGYAGALAGLPVLAPYARALAVAAVAAGLVGVGTSVMIYVVTGRRWWSAPRVGARFALTTALGGTSALLTVVTVVGAVQRLATAGTVRTLAAITTVATVGAVAAEIGLLRRADGPEDDEVARTARLHVRHLRGLVTWRLGLLALGGIAAPWLAVRMLTVAPTSATAAATTAVVGSVALLMAELLERWRFFTACAPIRMPGRLP